MGVVVTTIAVLGATSGIAGGCLREWVCRDEDETVDLRLVARGADRLARLTADLEVRGAGSIAVLEQALDGVDDVRAAADWVFADGPVDIVLVAFGDMPSQEEADADPAVAAHLLDLNGTLATMAAHLAALRLVEQGSGSLAVLGSVAGDRGRKSNYLYGSAKAMVATAVAGLQHRVAGTGVRITLVKPGPTATPMTDHLRGGMPLAPVEVVARDVVAAVDAGRPVVYTPRRWQAIMAIIRALPRAVFHRTNL